MEPHNPIPIQQIQPSPADVNALLALYNNGRYAEAESRTRALLELYPDFDFGWKLLGGILQIQGKDALSAFQKVVSLMPDDPEAHFNLGVIMKGMGQLDKAVASYQKASQLKPDYAEALNNLGNTLKDLGRIEESIASYRRAVELKPDFATYYNLGNAQKGIGHLNDAVSSYRRAIAIKPDFADAHNNLGTALKDLGLCDAALASYRRVVELKPNYAEAHSNLGVALKELGLLDAAVASYRRALELKPNYAQAHSNLGTALQMQGQLDAALASYRKAVEIDPDFAEAQSNMGIALKELGLFDEAIACCRHALELRPDYADAYNNLGVVQKESGQLNEAIASYQRAVALNPDFALAYYNLGNAQKDIGQLNDAVNSYRKAVQLKPDYDEAYFNLGNAFKDMGQIGEAVACYRKALEFKPDFLEALNNLGGALKGYGRLDESLSCYRKALEFKPDFVEAYYNLGNVLRSLGQLDAAVASCRKALELQPDFVEAQTNLLFSLNYTASHDSSYCLAEAHKYGRMISKKVTARFTSWQCDAKPHRLRVGIVSGDLHNHPVSYALKSLLSQLDPARVELIAYSAGDKTDDFTDLIRPYFSAWKPIFRLNDEVVARLIHDDGVHVLLDLSGHTGGNRLPMFAWKPAPVQASWLGYFATTGVAEMDYLMMSEMAVPASHKGQFTENIWYLPDTWLCFTPPDVDLPVASLPAQQNGYITFGCFQRMDKLGEGMLAAWASILAALPSARLRMASKPLGDPAVAAQLAERLLKHGIDPSQVTMLGSAPSRESYLARYSQVDVMLDSFPYPGVTTTCEALWMGVPTLTLAGETLLARQGAGVVAAASVGDWVATSVEDYITKAVALADDIPALALLRAGLREQVMASPLFDAPRFARNFEDALWGMWQARSQELSANSAGMPNISHD